MRIKFNRTFDEPRRFPAVKSALKKSADRIAAASGDGYESEVGEGRTRSRASVVTTTPGAIRDNAENNTLIKNLGAGRI